MSLAEYRIRDATEADLPAIVTIYNATIPSRMVTADTDPVTLESRIPWLHAHNPVTRPLWVVLDGDNVCAWSSLHSFHSRPAYYPTVEISIYVEEQHRRRGIGSGLLERIIDRAPAYQVRTLVGLIWAHNEPSLRLFRRHGFTTWGRLPRVAVLDELERDLVIVGRRVAP